MAQVNLGHVVGHGVPTGGTANQVLVKNGATNFDTSWKDASQLPAIGDEAAAREAADAALADGLAIIANGDTHAAVAAGKAVFVRSHSTLASGLYWASSAIGTNAALSTSNLTADASGGLNKLKADIDTLNSNLGKGEDISSSVTLVTGATLKNARKYGNRIIIEGVSTKITTANTFQNVGTIASGYQPSASKTGVVASGATTDFGYGQTTIATNGSIDVIYSKTTTYGLTFFVEYIV